MKNINIVGLGGIGSALCDNLCRYVNYLSEEEYLLTLMDGDDYEKKNKIRQSFTKLGNKASIKCGEMRLQFDKLNLDNIPEFINDKNVRSLVKDGDITFCCVDNHHTRRLLSKHMDEMDNGILISGGNDFTDGNVQIYIKKDGQKVTPSLTDYHPEIENPGDKSPEDMSCEELSKSAPQLLFTNLTAATIMTWAFYAVSTRKADCSNCSEMYFDIETMNVLAKQREPKN